MGLIKKLKENIAAAKEKSKENIAAAKEKSKEQYYVCPECGGTMKPVMLEIGGAFRKPKMRCKNCKLTMFLKDAKRELKHPEGKK